MALALAASLLFGVQVRVAVGLPNIYVARGRPSSEAWSRMGVNAHTAAAGPSQREGAPAALQRPQALIEVSKEVTQQQKEDGPCSGCKYDRDYVSVSGYPWEPLLDQDYIYDANNYLETFINTTTSTTTTTSTSTTTTTTTTTTTEAPPITTTTTVTTMSTSSTTVTTVTTTATTTETTTTVTTTTVTTVTETVTETETETFTMMIPVIVGKGSDANLSEVPRNASRTFTRVVCYNETTRGNGTISRVRLHTKSSHAKQERCLAQRSQPASRLLQMVGRSRAPAAGTSPCVFGVTPEDEGRHCIYDDGRHGAYGWCYTKADRSEWGSCSPGCPLGTSPEILSQRIDRLTRLVETALDSKESNEGAAAAPLLQAAAGGTERSPK